MPDVRICEMGPRDGLQSLPKDRLVPTEAKVALIEALAACGLDFIEAGSFVSRRAVPQLADSDELLDKLQKRAGVDYAALVPNMKNYARFQGSGFTTVAIFVSASEAYSQFNTRQSIEESMAAAGEVAAAARTDGYGLRAHLSAAFQDIDGGDSDLKIVVDLARRLLELGCDHVALADTKGTTDPRRTRAVLEAVDRGVGLERMTVHFHDSYGMGLANSLVSYECGLRLFDTSIGGIGGTPFKALANGPGGGGNVTTEELVYMFERMGVSTGVDFDGLLQAAEIVKEIVAETGGPPPPSKMLR